MHSDTSKRQTAGTARFRALGSLVRFLLYAVLSAAATVHWDAIVSQASALGIWSRESSSAIPSNTPLRGVWKESVQPTGSVQSALAEASVRNHGFPVLTGNGTGVSESQTEHGLLSGVRSRDALGTALGDASLFQLVADAERARLAEESIDKRGEGEGERHKRHGMGTGKREGKQEKIAFLFVTPSSLPLSKLWCQFFFGHESLYSIYVHSDSRDSDISQDLPSCFLGSVIPYKVSYTAH